MSCGPNWWGWNDGTGTVIDTYVTHIRIVSYVFRLTGGRQRWKAV